MVTGGGYLADKEVVGMSLLLYTLFWLEIRTMLSVSPTEKIEKETAAHRRRLPCSDKCGP